MTILYVKFQGDGSEKEIFITHINVNLYSNASVSLR